MSRQLYLGNHIHETLVGISHNLLDLCLREMAAVNRTVLIMPYRTDTHQLGISVYLYGPQLVVCQVPVKAVYLEHGQHLYLLFDKLHIVVMTRHIEHHATIREAGIVTHCHGGSLPLDVVHHFWLLYLGRQQLQKCLHAVKDALRALAGNGHHI